MAEHRPQDQPHRVAEDIKGMLPDKGPSASQVLAVVTLLPVGGILLVLSGLLLAGTVVGLALATPLFVIFSPVLVPATIVIGLAVTGFLASGAFGVTGLSSLSWIMQYVRGLREKAPEYMEQAKRRMQEAAGHAEQRAKEAGQRIQGRAQEGGGRT
ncbi:hypothetical protein Taro_037856 [Colocasia esculenta]|uniref:Oleosin n=1 Tax=Colocasia esculenta TaxID=4460 RepID=A0A843W578_COLES|nr:hypothetical protein [Colocasia esculenta]